MSVQTEFIPTLRDFISTFKFFEFEPKQVEFHKGSAIEFLKSKGIEAKNTNLEKTGQTILVFTNIVVSTPMEDDTIYAALRYLKYKRNNP